MIARGAALVMLIASAAFAAPRFERQIDVERAGPQRLTPDLALLAGAAPGFTDLRIYDRSNREVPYLLVQPRRGEAEWVRTRRFLIAPTKTTSGIEADAGQRREIDAVRVEGVRAPFLKRARIEGSGDRHRWTLLADTTVFDLPSEQLQRTVVEFQPAELRYVRITWDDTSSARVEGVPRLVLRIHGSTSPPQPLRSDVTIEKRPSEPGKSRYRIDLPAPALPVTAIGLNVPRGDVFRQLTVSEPRLAGAEIVPVTLGRGELRQAERDGLVASETTVAIASPMSDELDIVIDDGTNAPLAIAGATLQLAPQPWIYFEAPQAGAYTARYGDERAEAPRYDLEAARPFVVRARLSAARWDAPKSLAAQAAGTPPGTLPTRGAAIDRSGFAVARPLAPAGAGMSVLPLDAGVIAESRELADVRLVDADDRQVPFIVEQRNEPLLVEVIVPKRVEDGTESVYGLEMPYGTLPSGSRLVLEAESGVFERRVTLTDQIDGSRDPRLLASAVWRHADPDREPPPLTVNLPRRVAAVLELRIDEGDNAPLPIRGARLILPSFALRFIHPGTPLTLLYGNPAASTPQYDLALIAPRLFREPAAEIGFAGRTVKRGGGFSGERQFFWIAIGIVAVVLIVVLARVLGSATQSGP
ncbi:MAG TPA: DUF3999 family protein [Thermoanaerobaculia bacterium]|nr:DUF3999 family protein [Thermoanaerobaculia bacterium]